MEKTKERYSENKKLGKNDNNLSLIINKRK